MAALDRVPRSQIWATTAVSTVATGLSSWFHLGPWRWLTELQLVWLDAWYPQLNAFFLIGVGMAVLLPPLAMWHRASPEQPRPDIGYWRDGPGKWLAIGLVLAIIGLFSGFQGLVAGERIDLTLDSLPTSPAQHVRIPLDGANPGYAMGLEDDWYVPILRDGEVVAVGSVRTLSRAPELADLGDGSGMRATFGLPGPVLSSWQAAGLDVERDVPVVELGSSPTEKLFIGGCVGILGLPFLLLAGMQSLRRE